jgi:hypothetical protein
MGNVIKSQTQDIQTVIGNGLSVYVGGTDGILYLKDVVGNIQPLSDFVPTLPYGNYGLFAQTSNSTPITSTTSELSLIDGGVGTLSVPANGFSVGDSFNANMSGLMSAKNNDTLTIRIKSDSVVLAESPALVMPNITNQVWNLQIDFTIRQIGGTGVASIVTLGEMHVLKLASGTQEGFGFNTINNSTFDTTIPNNLSVTGQWSSNSSINSIYSNLFVLNKIY